MDTVVSYNWVAKESGLSIVEISTDSTGGPDELTYFYVPVLSGRQELRASNWVLYPNPWVEGEREKLVLQAPAQNVSEYRGMDLEYALFDLSRKRMDQGNLSLDPLGRGEIGVKGLPAGQYFVNVANERGERMVSQRIEIRRR